MGWVTAGRGVGRSAGARTRWSAGRAVLGNAIASVGRRAREAVRRRGARGGERKRRGRGSGLTTCPRAGRRRQDRDEAQGAPQTDWAAVDVDGGDAQHEVADGLRQEARRWRLDQEGAALREGRASAAIGEQPEVADADKAVWDDVEEEATKKLADLEVHDFYAVAVGIVAPAKADVAVGDGDEPLIGDRDAVGVTAKVGEDVVGPGEGRLAVDDPGGLAQFVEPRGERRGVRESGQAAGQVQGPAVEGLPQAGEIAATEDLGQGADGKQEAAPRGNPVRAVRGERAAGHDAVNVDVLGERLPPGVEHGGDAEVTAEVPGIAAEPRQGGRGGLEEQAVDQVRMALRQRVEGVGQREDDVEASLTR